MLPLAGKALGAILGSAYLLPFACSVVTPEQDPHPNNLQDMLPHFARSTSLTTWATRLTAR